MAGDDDTPLFKNVPRRPRSAAKPDGGDPGGIGVSNNASPPAMTSVASNKRPASSTAAAGGGGAEHVPRAKKKHRRVVPIAEPEPEDAKHRGVGALERHGGMPLALLSHKGKAVAAAAAAASSASSSESEPATVDWAENEHCRKGKTPVVNDEDDAVARRRPLSGKLLGDAIRSHRSTAAVACSFKPPSSLTKPKKPRSDANKPRTKPKKKQKPAKNKDSGAFFWCSTGRDGMSSAGSDADYSFDRIGVVSDMLRTTLRGLGVGVAGAPGPVRLYGRVLTRCDRDTQQTRLLMSSKRWRADGAEFPLCAFLTEDEKAAAHGEGLPLTAYDRDGHAYEIKFRFLECNVAYRLINKWGEFLQRNGLAVRKGEPAQVDDVVMLDLWMFRTPGGEVGMVMLHYRRGDAPHADAALDEVEQKRLQQLMLNNGAAASDAVMEDVVGGDVNEEGEDEVVAGVNGEEVAAASSPSEPEPDGVGAKAAEEQAGAPGEVADDAPSTSSELHGGAGRSDKVTVTAPLSSLGGDGTEEEQAQAGAGGALMAMVVDVEVATQSSLDSKNAGGGAANEVAAPPPSSPEQAVGSAAGKMATEDEDESADEVVEAAARSWNVGKDVFQAAQTLVMMSRDNSVRDSRTVV